MPPSAPNAAPLLPLQLELRDGLLLVRLANGQRLPLTVATLRAIRYANQLPRLRQQLEQRHKETSMQHEPQTPAAAPDTETHASDATLLVVAATWDAMVAAQRVELALVAARWDGMAAAQRRRRRAQQGG